MVLLDLRHDAIDRRAGRARGAATAHVQVTRGVSRCHPQKGGGRSGSGDAAGGGGAGWWSVQDGTVVVGAGEWPGVGIIGSGSGFGQVVEDWWWLAVVGPAQWAGPGEVTRRGLGQPPPAGA